MSTGKIVTNSYSIDKFNSVAINPNPKNDSLIEFATVGRDTI